MKNKQVANKKFTGFSDFERSAMKERAKELVAEARVSKNRSEGDKSIMAAITKMGSVDRAMAKRIHEIVTKVAPKLMPKTWYGMPAYANKDGKVICFFQAASKFKVRYSTFGFQPDANLDQGNLWPTSFAIKKLTSADEKKIAVLVKKAVS